MYSIADHLRGYDPPAQPKNPPPSSRRPPDRLIDAAAGDVARLFSMEGLPAISACGLIDVLRKNHGEAVALWTVHQLREDGRLDAEYVGAD